MKRPTIGNVIVALAIPFGIGACAALVANAPRPPVSTAPAPQPAPVAPQSAPAAPQPAEIQLSPLELNQRAQASNQRMIDSNNQLREAVNNGDRPSACRHARQTYIHLRQTLNYIEAMPAEYRAIYQEAVNKADAAMPKLESILDNEC